MNSSEMNIYGTFRWLPLVVLILVMSACAQQTNVPGLPDNELPGQWQTAYDTSGDWPEQEWWQAFATPELDELLDQVQRSNLDLASNRRNLESARLSLAQAGVDLLPSVAVSLGTGASYTETRTDLGQQTVESSGSTGNPLTLEAALRYADILSKPAVYSQAVASYDSRQAQAAELELNTLGMAASSYFQLLLTRDKIQAAEQNVANARAISDITQARVDAGVAVPIEALQQQITLQREESNLQSVLQNEFATRAALALLLSQPMPQLSLSGSSLEQVRVPDVTPGLPAELLNRRPDLVQRHAELRVAAAGVDISRLSFLPAISLTGSASASSTSLTELLSSPDTFFSLNASVLQTLLDTGQRRRALEQSRLTLENRIADYRQTALRAFSEIDVLLRSLQVLAEQSRVAEANLAAAEEAFRIAEVRYEEGVTEYQTVLTAQNTLFSSRNAYLDTKLARLNALISLYQALGGGWQAPI